MATVTTSSRFTINWADVWKGLKISVILPVLTAMYQSIENGSFVFDWKLLGKMAIGGFIAYIIKNFLSPAEIVITNPAKTTVDAVKSGEAEVTVIKS